MITGPVGCVAGCGCGIGCGCGSGIGSGISSKEGNSGCTGGSGIGSGSSSKDGTSCSGGVNLTAVTVQKYSVFPSTTRDANCTSPAPVVRAVPVNV